MKKHIEIFNKFSRRFANVADCGGGLIEVDFYEISSGKYGMEISKVVVQYFSEIQFVNILEVASVDIYEISNIFEVMPPTSLSGDSRMSKNLRDLYSYSVQIRDYNFGEIELSKPRERFLSSEIRKIFREISRFIHAQAP